MHWDGYTIFSVLSGVVLAIGGLASPGLRGKDRFYGFIGGAAFIGYGLFVAHQTSGTFFFPVWIFIIPPVGSLYLIVAAVKNRQPAASAGTGQAPSRPPAAPARSERPAVWAPAPPAPGRPDSAAQAGEATSQPGPAASGDLERPS